MEPSSSSFYHPFQPYEIQLQFMRALYKCIEDGNVGIFESPTGTGKSLSLVCGSLTWLRDRAANALEKDLDAVGEPDDPTWLVQSAREERKRSLLYHKKLLEERLSAARLPGVRSVKQTKEAGRPKKRIKSEQSLTSTFSDGSIEQFELEEYDSGSESRHHQRTSSKASEFSAETQALLGKLEPKQQKQELEPGRSTKIIFCSRTHSQLTQLVGELRKVKLSTPIAALEPSTNEMGHDRESTISEPIKHLSLGSRRHLCINPQVSNLGSSLTINEKCLELQRADTLKDRRCPFLPSEANNHLKEEFQDRALASIQDIEELGDLGRELRICPYYGTRSAADYSEIMTLPYPLLLQKSAREALGLSLESHVVIIDEGHNLMDAITGVNSVEISLSQIEAAISHLTSYVQTFKNRLKGSNRVYLAQVIRLLRSVLDCLQGRKEAGGTEGLLLPTQLLAGKNVDQLNPHSLIRYLHESKLLRKVEGFVEHQIRKTEPTRQTSCSVSNELMRAESLIFVLINPAKEGRFFFSAAHGSDLILRYTLLDPANAFREVAEQARAVIVAGGTMSPMSDYRDFLFPYLPQEKFQTFSFGHVVPPSNLLVQALGEGAGNTAFTFTFDSRRSEVMVKELGNTLIDLCQSIPDGIVVFFSSYDYISFIAEIWARSTNNRTSVLDRLKTVKPLFLETKTSTGSEELLQAYSASVDDGKGGLLFSVVGGKLSEGINFSDRLGRAVVMVGLPFPNIHTAEWRAKLEYIEESRYAKLREGHSTEGLFSEHEARTKAKAAGMDFYENVCMRAVNQCIGRVIRHRADYAAIYLFDRRYESAKVQKKLPAWIQQSIGPTKSLVDAIVDTKRFFATKAGGGS